MTRRDCHADGPSEQETDMTRLSNLRLLFALAVVGAAAVGCGGSVTTAAPAPAPDAGAPTAASACGRAQQPRPGERLRRPRAARRLALGHRHAGRDHFGTLTATATPDANGNYQPYCAVVGTINAGRLGTQARRPDRRADHLRDRLPGEPAERLERASCSSAAAAAPTARSRTPPAPSPTARP